MGFFETMFKSKHGRCVRAWIPGDDIVPDSIINIMLHGKMMFSKDGFWFEDKKGSKIFAKTPFIGLNEEGSYVYEITQTLEGQTLTTRIMAYANGKHCKFMSSPGYEFNIHNITSHIECNFVGLKEKYK
jgi:hypothetical protein